MHGRGSSVVRGEERVAPVQFQAVPVCRDTSPRLRVRSARSVGLTVRVCEVLSNEHDGIAAQTLRQRKRGGGDAAADRQPDVTGELRQRPGDLTLSTLHSLPDTDLLISDIQCLHQTFRISDCMNMS